MSIPTKLPGSRLIAIGTMVYAAVWISLEGALWRAVLLAVLFAAWSAVNVINRFVVCRQLTSSRWIAVLALIGLSVGFLSGALTLIVMSLKTGLHAHGPEFTPAEIEWVLRQTPVWATSGLLAGTGAGMISLARDSR